MTDNDSMNDFQDPALKAAVKHAWGNEKCPLALCRRIQAMMDGSGPLVSMRMAERQSAGLSMARRWLIWPLAAAAAIALAVGIKTLLHAPPFPPASPAQLAIALPASLEASLIQTHEHCCHVKNHHHLDADAATDSEVAKKMQTRLSQAVLVAHPADASWQYMGAAICPVGGVPAGHLVFAKGEDSISVFSLPQSIAPGAKEVLILK